MGEASQGSLRLALNLWLAVDVGGAQLSVFQAQEQHVLRCLSLGIGSRPRVPFWESHQSLLRLCLPSSPVFRVKGSTVRSWPSIFLQPCKSLSVPSLESKAMAWTWHLYLFSEVFPTPFLEEGHEVGTLEINCLAFEVWLGAWCGSQCLTTVVRTVCPLCSHECGGCSASCP